MYKVIKSFFDLQDNNYAYAVGDIFPHDNRAIEANRIQELASNRNKLGTQLIEEIIEKTKRTRKKKEEE